MNRKYHIRLIAIVIFAAAMAKTSLAAPPDPMPAPKIAIHIRNQAQIDDTVLEQSGEVASRLFRAAGIQVILQFENRKENRKENSDAESLPWCCQFYVLIMAPGTMGKMGLQRNRYVLGRVLGDPKKEDTSYVCIFDEAVNELLMEEKNAKKALILGYAIAHEIAHILLRQNNHSSFGVMQANWDYRAVWRMNTGTLVFLRDESQRIRAEVEGRLCAPLPSK
jgi:hypothetical protein